MTYCELQVIILITGSKWPPALHSFLFKYRNGRELVLVSDHAQGALLCRLGATWEAVQVQFNGT